MDICKMKTGMKRSFNRAIRFCLITIALFFLANHDLPAQEKIKSSKEVKNELRKKKEKQIERQNKAEANLRKRHLGIQDKATQKRMKAAKKKSDKLNRRKRRY